MTSKNNQRFHKFSLTFLVLFCAITCWQPAKSLTITENSVPSSNSSFLDQIAKEIESEHVSDQSYDKLAKIIESQPTNYRARLLLGKCYELLGLPEQAIEQYRLAFKYGPNDPKAVVELIHALAKAGQTNAAIDLIKQASKRFPNDPEVIYWVGSFLYSKNHLIDAEAMFTKAFEKNPDIPGLASNLGAIRVQQKRYAEALNLANKDLAKQPSYRLANEVAGLALIQLKRYKEAVKPLKIAFAEDPLKDVVSLEYARALYWTGDANGALRPALAYLAVTSNPYTNNLVAKQLAAEIIRHVDSTTLVNTINFISQKFHIDLNPLFHFSLADVLVQTDHKDLAIEQYKLGLELDPDFALGWFSLGQLAEEKHSYKEALTYFQKATVLIPSNQVFNEHLMRLQDRMATYNVDWAWQFKDWLNSGKR